MQCVVHAYLSPHGLCGSFAEGQKIESDFRKCSHFLVTCLNNTVKRGSFPYRELLPHTHTHTHARTHTHTCMHTLTFSCSGKSGLLSHIAQDRSEDIQLTPFHTHTQTLSPSNVTLLSPFNNYYYNTKFQVLMIKMTMWLSEEPVSEEDEEEEDDYYNDNLCHHRCPQV